MKVSHEQVIANRAAILDAAGRLFRERGFDDVTVADVMQAAGLTHGAFYGYFKSKDELMAAAMAQALAGSAPPSADLAAYVAEYLSPAHRDAVALGCATAALAAETSRQEGGARAALTQGLALQIERLSAIAPGRTTADKRQAAIGTWAAMVGALILARASEDRALSDEVLRGTRAFLGAGGRRPRSVEAAGRKPKR